MKSFAIGTNKRETLALTVLNYERPPVGEFYDDIGCFARFRFKLALLAASSKPTS